jgi:hypothetical protein
MNKKYFNPITNEQQTLTDEEQAKYRDFVYAEDIKDYATVNDIVVWFRRNNPVFYLQEMN